jgi:hypothetical protein
LLISLVALVDLAHKASLSLCVAVMPKHQRHQIVAFKQKPLTISLATEQILELVQVVGPRSGQRRIHGAMMFCSVVREAGQRVEQKPDRG